jgi:hypothetical protein
VSVDRVILLFIFRAYKKYFDVTTDEIKQRLIASLIPFNKNFFEIYKAKPDLYGPFWIYTTLIVMVAISGNFSRYLKFGSEGFTYDFGYVPVAATIIYTIGFGLPLVLKFAMKIFGTENIDYIELLGIYGYSYSTFVITALLCAIPVGILQWLLILYSGVASTGFLVVTYWQEVKLYAEKNRLIIMAIVVIAQLAILFVFKFYFFKSVAYEEDVFFDDDVVVATNDTVTTP